MDGRSLERRGWAAWLLTGLLVSGCVPGEHPWSDVIPEQRHLQIREPSELPPARLDPGPPPATVSDPATTAAQKELSLDEAIRIALANSNVIRVLAGTTAVTSGRTIYDPAISNTLVDEARAVFDPSLNVNNTFNRINQPFAVLDPQTPEGAVITSSPVDQYQLGVGVSKRTITGGTLNLNVADTVSRFPAGGVPLNPEERSSVTLSYTQPLLQGGGVAPNLAPIVIARINTEISFFQLKDSVEELVRGVIEAYWAVVFARTDVWARKQQVEQEEVAYERAAARRRQGFGNAAEVAQARVALFNFRANLIAAQANLLQREAALRNIMKLPPGAPEPVIPMTPPTTVRVMPKWEEVAQLAQDLRPDIVELKLILEADEQSLLIARNQALPRLDTTFLYRWNGLEGETPTRAHLETRPGQFTDWTVGVNFSVPLGLRRERAALRRAELVLARDQDNLDQGLHNALHAVGTSVRSLAESHEQYRAYQETRVAARENLDQQLAEFRAGRTIFLNVLQAISDWGNAVSSEAQALTRYNAELANLERQTGTILDTHGIRFSEERFGSIGPLGRCAAPRCYPSAAVPGPNADRYPVGTEPADEGLTGKAPAKPEPAPPPRELPPANDGP